MKRTNEMFRGFIRNAARAWGRGWAQKWQETHRAWKHANETANIAGRAKDCANAREAEATAFGLSKVEGFSTANAIKKAHAALKAFWQGAGPWGTKHRVRRRIIASLA